MDLSGSVMKSHVLDCRVHDWNFGESSFTTRKLMWLRHHQLCWPWNMANDTVTKYQNLLNRKFTSGLPSHVCLNRIDKAGHHVLLIQRKRNGRCSNFTRLPTTETRARCYIAKVTNWKKWPILSNCIQQYKTQIYRKERVWSATIAVPGQHWMFGTGRSSL
jgi:hypothetical protein